MRKPSNIGKTSAELRREAKRALLGRYGTACGGILLAVLFCIMMAIMITAVVMMVFVMDFGIISSLLMMGSFCVIGFLAMLSFMTGEIKICLRICSGEQSDLSELFFGLTHHPLRFCAMWLILYLGIGLIQGILLFLGNINGASVFWVNQILTRPEMMMVFMVLENIVLTMVMCLLVMRYLINVIILVDNPELSAAEAFRCGKELMRGNYGRLLGLWPGFVGMTLLGYFSFGIGFIWITPYLISVLICFYFDIREEKHPTASEPDPYDFYSWNKEDSR